LIDPDTPADAMWKKNSDGKDWKLVVGNSFSNCMYNLLTSTVF
jgi:hypothetical protein